MIKKVIEDGKESGYPSCCIKNFLWLVLQGFPSALYMDRLYRIDHGLNFVLCHDCFKNIIHYMEEHDTGNIIRYPSFKFYTNAL